MFIYTHHRCLSGGRHRHWLDAGLHVEPDQPDPLRAPPGGDGCAAQPVGSGGLLHCVCRVPQPDGTGPTVALEPTGRTRQQMTIDECLSLLVTDDEMQCDVTAAINKIRTDRKSVAAPGTPSNS